MCVHTPMTMERWGKNGWLDYSYLFTNQSTLSKLNQTTRFDLYVEVKLWQKAAETAFRLKDPGRLRQVQGRCGMPGLQRAIDDFIARV